VAQVALDADVVIAFLDSGDEQHRRAVELLRKRLAAGHEILIGASVYAEVMVRPLQRGAEAAVEAFLDGIGAMVVPIDRAVARRAAQLRARHRSLRLPDALALATALTSKAELLTLDQGLHRIATREGSSAKPDRHAARETGAPIVAPGQSPARPTSVAHNSCSATLKAVPPHPTPNP
jgi:predicted nucleic acid-binding protein